MKRNLVPAFLAVCLAVASISGAQTTRPKIGLALSGGGAKGCAHVGVLRQLEKMNIPIDYIAGTSMGSVVGALYASGMSPEEIEKELTTIDWDEVLSDATAFEKLTYRRKYEATRYPSTLEVGIRDGKIVVPAGIRTGQKLSYLLATYLLPHLDQHDFSRLPIPYAAVAADLETGDPVVLASGDLAEAVRASMSIPGAFTPVDWEGKILVDGGVTMNVPVDVVRAMGADIVIAVDIASPLAGREKLNSTMGVLGQLSGFLTRKNMEAQLAKADVVLSPDITGYDTFDFGKAAEIVKLGDVEAIARKDLYAKYAVDPETHDAMIRKQRVPRARNVVIDEIRVEGLHFVDERFVRGQMKTAAGESLDLAKLQKDIEWMYGWGDFIGIHAGLETTSGKSILVIRVQEKPWGPAYLRTGIGMETRYNNPGVFLLFNYTRRWLNPRGAEWRNDIEFGTDWGIATEFYQPRGYDKVGFLAPGADYRRMSLRLFEADQATGEYDVRQFTVRVDGGTQLRTAGEARLGFYQRWTDSTVEVGTAEPAELDASEGGLHGHLRLNTTNAPFFPVRGVRLEFDAIAPLDALGADSQYIATDLKSKLFSSFGRHVLSGGLNLHETFSDDAPIYDQAILGGLGNLGGYAYGELTGQAAALISLGYRNRVTRIPGLSDGVYAGLVAEIGDVYESLSDVEFGDMRKSMSLYLGMDTSYGPLIVGFAKSRDKERDGQYYVQIGRSF